MKIELIRYSEEVPINGDGTYESFLVFRVADSTNTFRVKVSRDTIRDLVHEIASMEYRKEVKDATRPLHTPIEQDEPPEDYDPYIEATRMVAVTPPVLDDGPVAIDHDDDGVPQL